MGDRLRVGLAAVVISAAMLAGNAAASQPPSGVTPPAETIQTANEPPPAQNESHIESLKQAVVRLPLATVLAALLAFRPRRKGTPPRKAPVIQTQIILAIVGAVVMLVVGASLARAFGIVGAAGLIRYRARIEDPKDAGVMLSTLALGLASGVGLYLLAAFTAVFVLGALWVIESFEPEAHRLFNLKITMKDAEKALEPIEATLRRSRLEYDLRTSSQEELAFEVKIPLERKVESISAAIKRLTPAREASIDWEEKKEKK